LASIFGKKGLEITLYFKEISNAVLIDLSPAEPFVNVYSKAFEFSALYISPELRVKKRFLLSHDL
jgi:hypothetical protein